MSHSKKGEKTASSAEAVKLFDLSTISKAKNDSSLSALLLSLTENELDGRISNLF
jgi:hypothetical protein